jgi:hypothetical protein|nr:MAG TPA: baseplate wedge protein [Caudoviricetes sp.]
MQRISTILKQFISERIPNKATNIFFQMFNGIEAMFTNLEYRLDIFKRENNILTAQNLSSLRSLAAQNGVEPTLRIPAKGILLVKISPKLFTRVGYPLFIKPYSVFTNKLTQVNYTYVSDKTIRIDSGSTSVYVPVIEGTLKQIQVQGSTDFIQRIYLNDSKIADKSIIIESNGKEFTEVKSFYDNYGLNNNRQFIIKWSTNPQYPIIVYIKGHELNQTINITYRLTNGELGNISKTQKFETESIVDTYGSYVVPNTNEISIVNISGFNMGSNGTDENSLRSAIGFNHSQEVLFDNISYRNFLSKFSTICLQDIKIDNLRKQINNIYVWKKICFDTETNQNIIIEYKKVIKSLLKDGLLSDIDKQSISEIISENEYCLSSHNLYGPKTNHYAIQIMFDNIDDMELHKHQIEELIYFEFSKFLYIRNHSINLESLINKYREQNNIKLWYLLFDKRIEQEKIKSLTNNSNLQHFERIETPYIINHTVDGFKEDGTRSVLTRNKPYQSNDEGPWLPLLVGEFDILTISNLPDNTIEYGRTSLNEPVSFVVKSNKNR